MSSPIRPMTAVLLSGATVFALDDLRILWRESNANALRDKVKYYVDSRQLFRLHRGIYAISKDYNPCELAQKLIRPSYISLETALRMHGVIHQYSSMITCIASYPRVITIDGRTYRYHTMKGDLLSLPLGIRCDDQYAVASPERALCDSLYLGFQPDTEGYHQWNSEILRRLEREFAVPRVTRGLFPLLQST